MGKRRQVEAVGAEEARQHLPKLLERAHRGEVTIITRRGEPCAALVPVGHVRTQGSPVPFTSLRGGGRGLWGDVAQHVAELREDWE